MWTENFQTFKLDLEKAEEPEVKMQHQLDHRRRKGFQKNIYLSFTDYSKAFDCMDHKNCGKLLKKWEYQTALPASWEICMQVKRQQLEMDMEQQTGSK